MLIFLNFGGANWWIGPLLTLLPFLLTSGILTAPLQLLRLLFGIGTTRTYVYDAETQLWQPQGARGARSEHSTAAAAAGEADEEWGLLSSMLIALTSMVATAALTVLLLKLVELTRRDGLRPTLRRLLFEGFGGGWGAAGGGANRRGAGGQAGRRQLPRTRSERIERVAKLMQALPLEVYRTKQELDRMPVAELKRLIKKRGAACEDCLEKAELVQVAQQAASNSSASTCTVCCMDYESGDVLRVLHCGHRFHLECVDRWLLSSTDYSRSPACPICNAELDAAPAAPAAGARGTGSG